MTAQFDSQDPQDSGQQSSNDYENYVPEREFVLMPLFRRIGQMFRMRRHPVEEPNYEAPTVEQAPREQFVSEEPPAMEAPVTLQQQEPEPASPVASPAHSAHSVEAQIFDGRDEALPVSTLEHGSTPEPSRIAPLFEAAKAVSGAFSEAAQWSHRKASELFDRAHTNEAELSAPAAAKEPIPFPVMEPAASASSAQEPEIAASEPARETAPAIQADPQLAAPGLQREMAWEERSSEPQVVPPPAARKSASPYPGPPRVATWWQHRIDWSAYLTSKRVALLGGLAMAALIILGISLARRPASDMLPEQTATHRLEPGGVTLSTHPVLTRTGPQQQGNPVPSHSQVRNSRPVADSGPEVVTHYYSQKPSPVHQATADGVRHYSDLN